MLRSVTIGLGLIALHCSIGPCLAADRDLGVTSTRVTTHHRYGARVVRYGCPDGYGCAPLYGAYGPYGGRAYWSSFSYLVPPERPVEVIYSRY